MQGLVDQMAAGVARIEAMGITLRDIPDGLVDFPALVNGRQVWLCWKRGEPEVALLARPRSRGSRVGSRSASWCDGSAGAVADDRRTRTDAPRRIDRCRRRPAPRRSTTGLAAYERGDFFEAHELLEPAWMGTDDPAERAVLQGLIKLAAAYVHDVRGNPAGIRKNLDGARSRLVEGQADRRRRISTSPALIAAIDARLRRPRRPSRRPDAAATRPAQEDPMTMPGAVPTIDVAEADRRLREDPERPVLVDVREPGEFATVRAPGAMLVPTSTFMARMADLPADRPLLVICHVGGRSAAVTSFLLQRGRTDVANVAGGMEAWERAGLPVRRGAPEPGEGDIPA